MRLLGIVVTEAARASRAKWPELAQVVRELAARLDKAVDKSGGPVDTPEQHAMAALEGAEAP